MIVRPIRYAGPSATVRTLLGDLLRPSDYELLLNASDIPELLAVLRTTRYATVLRTQGKSFAFVLQHHWIARTEKVANLMPAGARELCLAYLAKVELEVVKALLRGIARGVERGRVLSMLPPLPTRPSVRVADLLAANSLERAADALKNTAYAEPVAEAIKRAKGGGAKGSGGSLLPVETALEHLFFARLIAACRHFSGFEHAILSRLVGTLADAANVLAAQRLRKTFHLTPQETSTYLVPLGFRVRAAERRALCDWSGDWPPPIWLGDGAPGTGLRVTAMRLLCSEATKPLFTAPFHAGLAIAYVLLTELEAADLVAIYEGKQWGMERAAIADRLIRFHGPALTGTPGV
jgi:vacuolar-type H+-ATPase subunit C/Vma6